MKPVDSARLERLLARLDDPASASSPPASWGAEWLPDATDPEVLQLVQHLRMRAASRSIHEQTLAGIFHQLGAWMRRRAASALASELIEAMRELYRALGAECFSRCYLLQALAATRQREALRAFADLMAADPPPDRRGVGLAIGPLFQSKRYDPAALFPRLWEGIGNLSVAAPILDLCNFVTREGLVDEHPASARKVPMIALLGAVVERLSLLEEAPDVSDAALGQVAGQVEDGVALAVALCDACALLGDTAAVGKLRQALELRHRRLRTEAAGALAKLGDESGRAALVALAAEPVCRLRVLAYAEELDLLDQIEPRHRTRAAQAESELALWLAQPEQMGIPPAKLELIDERTQYWPGFEEPVDCYLYRFAYPLAAGTYSNIGIAGPLAHAFAADLADLAPDDIYAAFAGWHVEHEEIYEVDAADLDAASRMHVARLERRLRDAGFAAIQPLQLGCFFGERLLVAQATSEGQKGVTVADPHAVLWYRSTGGSRPIGPHEALCIYKGRKLLRSFNA